MRQLGVLFVMVVVCAVAVSSGVAIDKPQTFSLLDVSRQDSQPIGGFTFNRAPRGGDQFAVADDLYRWAGTKKGARAGSVEGVGFFVTGFGDDFSHPAKVQFTVQAHLQGGTVMMLGFASLDNDGPSRFTLPVVGGTGIYANARGYVVVRDLGTGNEDKSNVDVHVMP